MKPAPSHVYPITTNDLTWAPQQACGHIKMEILLSFAAGIYCLYETVSLAPTSFWLDKCFVFIPQTPKLPGRESSHAVTHGDDSSAGNRRASPVPTGSSTPMKKPPMPHRLKEAKNGPSAKQLENIMIASIKLSLILTGTAGSTGKHCPPCTKRW